MTADDLKLVRDEGGDVDGIGGLLALAADAPRLAAEELSLRTRFEERESARPYLERYMLLKQQSLQAQKARRIEREKSSQLKL